MKQLFICGFLLLLCIFGLLFPCSAEEGYWQRFGEPYCRKIDPTNGGQQNCGMRQCTFNHTIAIWRDPFGKGPGAILEFHWWNPPGIIKPGEVAEIIVSYVRNSGWSPSSDATAQFYVVMDQQGKDTSKQISFLHLSVPLATGKGLAQNEVSNKEIKVPLDVKGDIEVRFRLEKFLEMAFPYKWIKGPAPKEMEPSLGITIGIPNCCKALLSPPFGRVYDIHVTDEPDKLPNAEKAKSKQPPTDLQHDVSGFRQAVENNILEQVKSFIKAGMSPDATDRPCLVPLLIALERKYFDLATILIDAGAKVNAKNCDDNTALMLAASKNNMDLARKLIHKGADLNAKNNRGETALMYAVSAGSLDMVELLMKNGARVKEKNRFGDTALMRAMSGCKSDIARALLNAGAEVNIKDDSGFTALLLAVFGGCEDITQMLLASKANINSVSKTGSNPLVSAIAKKKENSAHLLINTGAAINVSDDEGITPLMVAIRNGITSIALELIERGANVNARESLSGRTPLMLATFFGDNDIVQALLKKGVSVGERDFEGWTPLHWAVYNGNRYLVHQILLTSTGASPYHDERQYVILINEISRLTIVKLLIAGGADVNAQSNVLGITPLMLAAIGKNKEVVRLLLDSGAKARATTRHYGITSTDCARLGGNEVIIAMLDKAEQFNIPNDSSISNKLKNPLLMEIVRKTPWSKTDIDARFDDFTDGYLYGLLIEPVLRELTKTGEGNSLLFQFVRNHPDISSTRITAQLKMDLIAGTRDRAFWTFITQHFDKHVQTTAAWAGKLPYEERVKLMDIWLEWLSRVNPAQLIFPRVPSSREPEYFSYAALDDATKALHGIYDKRIPPAYHRIFDSADKQSSLGNAAMILYDIGDPESYPRI